MQPGATELLIGIKNIIFNILLPELQSEQARGQVMYSSVLIDHLIARWEIEGPLLLEERAELRALLTQALAVLGDDARIDEALAAASDTVAGPRALAAANERMRTLVPALARALPPEGAARVQELAATIRAYIRNQHRRDQQLVAVGGLEW
ncbi:MAG: hypothetical protein HYR72_15245 [Deltaproteobacteria bacterium]|nr:hypothetical protein [Deltaproteobacteria bacterium]MBI3390962.1 hypothetical protein [Deltaproteobacteria bacterium]